MIGLSDDLHSVPVGTWSPTTLRALLRELGLSDADQATQAAAVPSGCVTMSRAH